MDLLVDLNPEMEQQLWQIDVEAIFKAKKPALYRWVPRFILNWVKKTIHQEEINDAMRRHKHLRDMAFAEQVITNEIKTRTTSQGSENIPKTGGAIIVANHPLGGMDGMILMVEAGKVRSDVRVIVNDILAAMPNFGEVFLPINKLGIKAKESLQRVEDAYASGKLMLVFPAGLCSRKIDGRIRDLEWQKSFVSRALKYNLPVIPTFFSGQNSNRFYSLANIRKKLGIKANIEMFFLPDEMFRQRGKTIHITFGKPIPASVFREKYDQHEWANLVRDYVYELGSNPEADFVQFADLWQPPVKK